MPANGILAALLFLSTWNEFLLALVLLADNPKLQTAPLALSFFAGNRGNSDPSVTAATQGRRAARVEAGRSRCATTSA